MGRGKRKSDEPVDAEAKKTKESPAAITTSVSGRVKSIELENFMNHEKLKVEFDLENNNCFYIGGPNGSGKSALFAALNIGLGGRGNQNDRGNRLQSYIKDGKNTARIRIVLSNFGSSADPTYGEWVIVERTISQTNVSMVIKTVNDAGKEIRVSTKKGDLDKLLSRYGIQLVNPIFWMSQDRSRHFLQQMKPAKLYEMYELATQLDSTREEYAKLDQALENSKMMMAHQEQGMADRRREIRRREEEVRRLASVDRLERELAVIEWMRVWLPLRDALADTDKLQQQKVMTIGSILKMRERMEENREMIGEGKKRVKQLCNKIDRTVNESRKGAETVKNTIQKARVMEVQLKETALSLAELEERNKKDETEANSIQDEIKRRENYSVYNGTETEAVRLERRRSEIEEMLSKLQTDIRREKEVSMNMETGKRKKWLELEAALSEMRDIEWRKNKTSEKIQQSAAVGKNPLARFGMEIPEILQTIEENSTLFEFKPLGPIGRLITVTDSRWALAVEYALEKVIESFVLHSQRDREILIALCEARNLKIPNIILANFNLPSYNTKELEPDGSIITIDRAIQCSHTVIRNCLLDTARIEQIMLIESDEQARELLNRDGKEIQSLRNVRRAFTRTGGCGTLKTGRGGYRFYPNNKRNARPKFLLDGKGLSESELHDLHIMQSKKFEECEKRVAMRRNVFDNYEKAFLRTRENITAYENKQYVLELDRRLIDRRLFNLGDEESPEAVDDAHELRESLRDYRGQIEKSLRFIYEKRKFRFDLTERLSAANRIIATARRRQAQMIVDTQKMEDELEITKSDIDRRTATHERFVANLRKLEEEERTIHKKFIAFEKKREEAMIEVEKKENMRDKFASTGGKPAEFDDPPNMDLLPTTEEAAEAHKELIIRIEATKKRKAEFDEARTREILREHEKHLNKFKQLKKIQKTLDCCQQERKENLPVIQHALTMRLKLTFEKLMGMRDYKGEIHIDDELGTLEIKVTTPGEKEEEKENEKKMKKWKREEKERKQDLKSLSGGERSYTTACFLMSLWEIMEAPFRCMDEFDVFMDMVNRKVVMELLVKLATEQFSHNQFIFFTPQGIRELGNRKKVQIFEMPKVRG